MALTIVRYLRRGQPRSDTPQRGVKFGDKVAPIEREFATTGDFVKYGLDEARQTNEAQAKLLLSRLDLVAPVTSNQQFVCQGINYESHARESGMDPDKLPFNLIFTKASSCLSGPYDDVVKPRHVKLLDYEIELGLIVRTDITHATTVRDDNLHEYLAAITIVNDVSARDIQLPQGQFYKGKSYRSFGPVGPYLLVLEPGEWRRVADLRMSLEVNGQVRQQDYCGNMLTKPPATLTELSGLQNLYAGDLIATGTPAGCAAHAPGRLAMALVKLFVPDTVKWKAFIKGGSTNPQYLKDQDIMTLSIRTDDGMLDLGTQRTRVIEQ